MQQTQHPHDAPDSNNESTLRLLMAAFLSALFVWK